MGRGMPIGWKNERDRNAIWEKGVNQERNWFAHHF
jgi:hypothetical protein